MRDYPPALAAIVRRALAARAEDRYPSAAVLRSALEGFARQQLRLDTSSDALARLLASRYGTPALPDLETPPPVLTIVPPRAPDAATVSLAPASSGTIPRRRPRSHRVTVGALGVLAGGLLGWQIARTSAASADELPAPVIEAIERDVEPLHQDAIVAAPPRLPDVPTIVVPVDSEPTIVVTDSEPTIIVTESDDAPRKRRRRLPRKVKKPAPELVAAPSRTADAMLPRSAR